LRTLCDQFCGTYIHWDKEQNCYLNDRDNKPHKCPIAERAKEFQGKKNMIQIGTIRPHLEKIQKDLNELNQHIHWVEALRPENNIELAKRFDKRKELGKKRNRNEPTAEAWQQ
jgi:hypothetical protein